MKAWWLFTQQAGVPPREPVVPKRRGCLWCGGLLDGHPQRRYCSDACSSRARYIRKAGEVRAPLS